jgi:hypothetical protein
MAASQARQHRHSASRHPPILDDGPVLPPHYHRQPETCTSCFQAGFQLMNIPRAELRSRRLLGRLIPANLALGNDEGSPAR